MSKQKKKSDRITGADIFYSIGIAAVLIITAFSLYFSDLGWSVAVLGSLLLTGLMVVLLAFTLHAKVQGTDIGKWRVLENVGEFFWILLAVFFVVNSNVFWSTVFSLKQIDREIAERVKSCKSVYTDYEKSASMCVTNFEDHLKNLQRNSDLSAFRKNVNNMAVALSTPAQWVDAISNAVDDEKMKFGISGEGSWSERIVEFDALYRNKTLFSLNETIGKINGKMNQMVRDLKEMKGSDKHLPYFLDKQNVTAIRVKEVPDFPTLAQRSGLKYSLKGYLFSILIVGCIGLKKFVTLRSPRVRMTQPSRETIETLGKVLDNN